MDYTEVIALDICGECDNTADQEIFLLGRQAQFTCPFCSHVTEWTV